MPHGKKISKKKAIDCVDRYKKNHPKSTNSVSYDASIIQELLDIPNCVTVRIHLAETDEKTTTLVLVAVDKDGNAILPATDELTKDAAESPFIVNEGTPCPPTCPKGDL